VVSVVIPENRNICSCLFNDIDILCLLLQFPDFGKKFRKLKLIRKLAGCGGGIVGGVVLQLVILDFNAQGGAVDGKHLGGMDLIALAFLQGLGNDSFLH
jgi:hypothetical protein